MYLKCLSNTSNEMVVLRNICQNVKFVRMNTASSKWWSEWSTLYSLNTGYIASSNLEHTSDLFIAFAVSELNRPQGKILYISCNTPSRLTYLPALCHPSVHSWAQWQQSAQAIVSATGVGAGKEGNCSNERHSHSRRIYENIKESRLVFPF